MIDPPKRTGYRLTYDAECMYNDWQEIGGCSCHTGCAPCRSCHNDGHPISLEENDEAWELDNQEVEMSRQSITDKSSPPKSEWFGFKYKVTPEESKLLQEAVFKDGGVWEYESSTHYLNIEYTVYWILVDWRGRMNWTECPSSTLPEKQPPQPKKDFVVGKWYKCICTAYPFLQGNHYKVKAVDGCLWFENTPCSSYKRCFDINSESDFNPNTKESVAKGVEDSRMGTSEVYHDSIGKWAVPKEYSGIDLSKYIVRHTAALTDLDKQTNFSITKEEVNMSTNTQRKTVTVNLIDRDSALDEKFALVATFGEFTTSKSPEALIRSIIIDPKNNVAKLIAQHNEVRVTQTNKEIMERTGNKVTLEPVEESDLHWEIR